MFRGYVVVVVNSYFVGLFISGCEIKVIKFYGIILGEEDVFGFDVVVIDIFGVDVIDGVDKFKYELMNVFGFERIVVMLNGFV